VQRKKQFLVLRYQRLDLKKGRHSNDISESLRVASPFSPQPLPTLPKT
jgi:hypothetical protein